MTTHLSTAELRTPLAATGRRLRRHSRREASLCSDNKTAVGVDVGRCRKHAERVQRGRMCGKEEEEEVCEAARC